MNTPPGYIRMNRDEVLRRCELVIDQIKQDRAKNDKKMIANYIKRHEWWSFLPWWKPITRDQAKAGLMLGLSFFPSISSWGALDETEELLEAAHTTKMENMWIAVGAYILRREFEETNNE